MMMMIARPLFLQYAIRQDFAMDYFITLDAPIVFQMPELVGGAADGFEANRGHLRMQVERRAMARRVLPSSTYAREFAYCFMR